MKTLSLSVVGKGWFSQEMAYIYDLRPHDVENIGELTRENIQRWLNSNAGDFQSIEDFAINATTTTFEEILPWATEEGELVYADIMFPE